MPNNEGMRRQPPPGGVGGAKLWNHFLWTPINWPRGEQKPRAAMHHATSAQAQHDGIYRSYLFPASPFSFPELRSFWSASEIEALGTRMSRHGPIMYAVRIVNVCFLWSFQRLKTPKGRISHSLLQYKRNNRDHWHMVLLLLKTQIQSLTYVAQTKLKIAHVNLKLFKIVL